MRSLSPLVLLASLLTFTLLVPLPAFSQADTELADAPPCTQSHLRDWAFIRDKSLGVAARDPVGQTVGPFGARKRIVFKFGPNWFPMSGRKETLCGTLDRFGFFPGLGEIDREEDWNNFIIPDPDFAYLITEVHQIHKESVKGTAKCGSDRSVDCIEAEVTVHDNFFENRYFTRSTKEAKLKNQKLCTYGTWIREKVHNNHAEIHPSELFWWTAPAPSGTRPAAEWWLMLLQDNSNRFNSRDDFSGAPPGPPGWHPWAGSPRTASFKLAFEAKDGVAAEGLRVKQEESHGVAPSAEDTGTVHVLKHNGAPVLRVTEEQATDRVGVRFTDVCRDQGGNRLIGYVELTARVQADANGDGGYQVLRVTKEAPPAPPAATTASVTTPTATLASLAALAPAPTPAPEMIMRSEIMLETMRRIVVDGRPRLVADVKAEISAPTEEASAPKFVKSAQVVAAGETEKIEFRQAPEFVTASQPASDHRDVKFVLGDVPLNLGWEDAGKAKFELKTRVGKQELELPQPVLAPEVGREAVLSQTTDASALNALLSAAGGSRDAQPDEPVLALQPVKVGQLKLDVAASYAPQREDGRPAREDMSPVGNYLNLAIDDAARRNDSSKMQRLFGTTQPFKMTTWKFSATNLATGQAVPVREVSAEQATTAPGEVSVVGGSGAVAGGSIKIIFPEQPREAIYELTMTATMADSNGGVGTFEHRVWSHHLPIKSDEQSVESLLKLVAVRAGVSPEDLSRAWQSSTSEGPVEDASVRRARMFRLHALQAAEDEQVTVDELQSLVQAAKLFAGK